MFKPAQWPIKNGPAYCWGIYFVLEIINNILKSFVLVIKKPIGFFNAKPTMASSCVSLVLLLFTLLLGHGLFQLEASKNACRNTHTAQPYRTSYHFQPAMNWMNGNIFFSFLYLKFSRLVNLVAIVYISNDFLCLSFEHVVIVAWTKFRVSLCRS